MDAIEGMQGFVELLGALLVPMLAIVTVVILILQYVLARRQWRLAVWDKRYELYKRVERFVGGLLDWERVSQEDIGRFQRDTDCVKWLFKKDVKEFMHEVVLKGIEFAAAGAVIEELEKEAKEGKKKEESVAEEKKKWEEQRSEVWDWFADGYGRMGQVFGRYLRVRAR
jgi:ABC-type transport system involved in cytochrome bd biosynthesis fused ATPase/permease subunit